MFGIVANLGTLALFKYFNFFIDSFIGLISNFGYELPYSSTRIVLPVGISFYIFLSLSYIIDVFRHDLKADNKISEVLLSVGFFPIILAGPIQRPATLLPQISNRRVFDYNLAIDGLRQFLWGLFAKIVIADNISVYTDNIFNDYSTYSGSSLVLGATFYAVQIYADFSGYSNMAIGTAKILGFRLMKNFEFPYFSRDIREFWRKWHISLTTWFRDYVFLPLSASISAELKKDRVLFIRTDQYIYITASLVTWSLTGLWHGTYYTFLIWGILNAVALIIYNLHIKRRRKILKKLEIKDSNKILAIVETFLTLTMVTVFWIFFRSDSLGDAFDYIGNMFSGSLFSMPENVPFKNGLLILVLFTTEWLQRTKEHALDLRSSRVPAGIRWLVYYTLIFMVLWHGDKSNDFIYFQF